MYSEQNSKIFFNSYLDDKICSFCTQFPLCKVLSYKEMAIIHLFQIKYSEGVIYLTTKEIYSEFLKFYRLERDGYETFISYLENLSSKLGILIKFKKGGKSGRILSQELGGRSSATLYYSLNPCLCLDSIDLNTIANLCPVGYDELSYQILELLNYNNRSPNENSINRDYETDLKVKSDKINICSRELIEGLTIDEIISNLTTKKKLNKNKIAIRRALRKLLGSGVIFSQRTANVTEPIRYQMNESYFFPVLNNFLS